MGPSIVFRRKNLFGWMGPSRQWQDPNNRVKRKVMRHPQKLHVWAAAGYFMKCNLYFFQENLNANLYQKIIKKTLMKRESVLPLTPPGG